jgi:dienelactone hydrolase
MRSENLLGAYGGWAGELAAVAGSLSFDPGRWSGVEAWRRAGRRRLRQLLGPLPARKVGKVELRRRYRLEDLEVEELSWQLPYGPPAEGIFLWPAAARGPLPGILALHDHGGVKYFGRRKIARGAEELHPLLREHQERYYGGRPWANELARRGYAVLAHDVIPFGSRRVVPSQLPGYVVRRLAAAPGEMEELTAADIADARPDPAWDVPPEEPREALARYEAFAGRHEEVLARSLFAAGTSLPACYLGEDRVALELLARRPEVDRERLGCCGLSGGGLRTVFLAGLEDRVRCAVCAGFMSSWRDFVLNKSFTHSWMLYVPGLARSLEFPEILGLRAPLPSLVLATAQDPLFTLGETRAAGGTLERLYAAAGAPERFALSVYPGPHCFDLPMQEEAFAWLERWLRA